jgi:hypothetical protein
MPNSNSDIDTEAYEDGYGNFNPYAVVDSHQHALAYFHGYGDGYADRDPNPNAHAHQYRDSYADGYSHGDRNRHADANPDPMHHDSD